MTRLSTGNPFLDREIGGGLEPGRIVGLRMAPGSQGELLLKSFAIANDAMYLSTTRTNASIEAWLSAGEATGIKYAGIDGLMAEKTRGVGDLITAATDWGDATDRRAHDSTVPIGIEPLEKAVENATQSIVIDPVNPLEELDEGDYMTFLHGLRHRLTQLDQVALLRLVETSAPLDNRWLTLDIADEVWDLSVEINNERVEFHLTVIKSRSGNVPRRLIKLQLDETVAVDTSRDIS